MGKSINPALIFSAGIDGGSLKRLESDLTQGMRKAVEHLPAEFQKIASLLGTAFDKADPTKKLEQSLRSVVSQMSRGNFGQAFISELDRIGAAADRLGNTNLKQLSDAATSVHRIANRPVGDAAQYQAALQQMAIGSGTSRLANQDWVRRVHVAEHIENMSQANVERLRSGNFGSAGPDQTAQKMADWLRNEQGRQQRQRIDAHANNFEGEEAFRQRTAAMYNRQNNIVPQDPRLRLGHEADVDRRVADQQGYEAQQRMLTGNAWRQRIDAHADRFGIQEHNRQQQLEVDRYQRENLRLSPEGTRRTHSFNDPRYSRSLKGAALADDDFDLKPMTPEQQARYQSMPANIQQRMDRARERQASRGNRSWGSMQGHNFRFATQNLGFGIDDAIQSYHYGGIGASIRAASNNATAIAGMAIPNPAIAAATVVGLSVATAALPSILKRLGIDEKMDKIRQETADSAYKRDGSSSGIIRRNSMTTSLFSDKTAEYFKLTDQENANNDLRQKSNEELGQYGPHDRNGGRMAWNLRDTDQLAFARQEAQRRGPEALAKFDAAVKWRLNDADTGHQRGVAIGESAAHLDMLFKAAPQQFRAAEGQRVRDKEKDIALYQARDLFEYENSLGVAHNADLAAIDANDKLGPAQKHREKQRIRIQYEDDLSRKMDNEETIKNNSRTRRYNIEDEDRRSFGFNDAISQANIDFRRKDREHQDNKMLTIAERAHLQDTNSAGYQRRVGRLVEDEVRGNQGFNDPLSSLKLQHARAIQDYTQNPDYNPDQRRKLLASENEGFAFREKRTKDAMLSENRIQNDPGRVAEEYKRKAEDLKRTIEANPNMDPGMKAELETNLKQSFARDLKESRHPAGHERFTTQSMTVGSQADRELEMRMTGTFVKPKEDERDKIMQASLDNLIDIAKILEAVEAKLAVEAINL